MHVVPFGCEAEGWAAHGGQHFSFGKAPPWQEITCNRASRSGKIAVATQDFILGSWPNQKPAARRVFVYLGRASFARERPLCDPGGCRLNHPLRLVMRKQEFIGFGV